jgi:NAD(P)H-hydrate epimerase
MITLTRAQVRELDRRAIEEFGVPGIVLMENAGRGAAEVLMRLNGEPAPVVVVCGKGNNGGDGYVIARHLENAGWPASIWSLSKFDDLRGDAATNAEIARRAEIAQFADPAVTDATLHRLEAHAGWIVDALFGTGLSGPIAAPFDRVIAAINASGAHVLAVDIPSGLDCDTGEPLGPTVQADHTVTFVTAKAGFPKSIAAEWLGELHVVGIGAPRALLRQYGIAQPE